MGRFTAGMRKACSVIKLNKVVYLCQWHVPDNSALGMRMKEITLTRVHYGYRRVHVMLSREDFRDSHKRIYTLYREQGGHCGKSVLSATRQLSLDSLRSWRCILIRSGAWTLLQITFLMDASFGCSKWLTA